MTMPVIVFHSLFKQSDLPGTQWVYASGRDIMQRFAAPMQKAPSPLPKC